MTLQYSCFFRAFASGCTALTGVEAVSNGIPNFKVPSQKNPKAVLLLLAFLVLFIFGGLSFLATIYRAVPVDNMTVIAQIAQQVFGNSIMFYIMQITTAFILIMAANTAYADLPLLFSLMAKDGYVPRQFAQRGKRLSFSNGIIILGIASSLLIIMFNGEISFTLTFICCWCIFIFYTFTVWNVFKVEKK